MDDVYERGTSIALVEHFWAIDVVANSSAPADPTTVTFEVLSPDGQTQSFVFGVDDEVTNPQVGEYVLTLPPQLPPGEWRFAAIGTGTVQQQREDSFTVLESGVLPPEPSTVATPGPCSSWIDGDEVAAFDSTIGVGSETWRLDDVAYGASALLYELSGRQFPGVCERTVRPCRSSCGCWGSESMGMGIWFWTSSWFGGLPGDWFWRNEAGETCGCGSESYIRLAGYPVREILDVKIDGASLAAEGEYRLDQRRNLIRLADLSGPTPVDRFWPACQDLSLPDTEPGTYSVTYTWGADVPWLGRQAAAQLAGELWKASPTNAGKCQLPTRVVRVVRQGIEMDRISSTAGLFRQGATGLQLVDAFLAQVNPTKQRMRSAVWSPDMQQFARKVGQ